MGSGGRGEREGGEGEEASEGGKLPIVIDTPPCLSQVCVKGGEEGGLGMGRGRGRRRRVKGGAEMNRKGVITERLHRN